MSESVFISYAREDSEAASEVFVFFAQLGLDVFRDVEGLVGAEDWREHILGAAKRSRLFVFLASATSLSKGGMIDEELDVARAKLLLDDDFLFLTIRLDGTPLRDWMGSRQYLSWQAADLFDRVTQVVNRMLDPDNESVRRLSANVYLNARPRTVEYETDACSYRYSVPSIAIVGDRYVADEVNALIRGRIAEAVLRMRKYSEAIPIREGTMQGMIVVDLIDADVSENNVGLSFEHFTYSSGAAHPNHDFIAINIGRSPWGLVEAEVRADDLPELARLVANAVKSGESEFLWDHEQLVSALERFEYDRYTVFVDGGAKLMFPDYAIGAYVNGPSVLQTGDKRVVRLLHGNWPDDP